MASIRSTVSASKVIEKWKIEIDGTNSIIHGIACHLETNKLTITQTRIDA